MSSLTEESPKGRLGWGVHRAIEWLYPNYVSENDLFAEATLACFSEDSVALDAGCGSGAIYRYEWKNLVRRIVGCDVSAEVASNTNVNVRVRGDLANLPFADGSFDVIFTRYVLEHLRDPTAVFKEFSRILKHGGRLIILTPSRYHYVTLLSRLTSQRLHEKVGTLRGIGAQDLFPTAYLANSKRDLERCALRVGMKLTKVVRKETRPNYLMWFLPLFLAGAVYERLVNRFEFLGPLRVSIIAVFERNSD